jgi:hypothetical protein
MNMPSKSMATENGVLIYIGWPEKWKICSYFKNETYKKAMYHIFTLSKMTLLCNNKIKFGIKSLQFEFSSSGLGFSGWEFKQSQV